MSRKKTRTIDSDSMLTFIFVGLLILSCLFGIIGELAHAGASP